MLAGALNNKREEEEEEEEELSLAQCWFLSVLGWPSTPFLVSHVDPGENELHIPVLYWNSHIIAADCCKYSHLHSN